MPQGRISTFQLLVLMFQLILSSSMLLMPTISTALAKKDMWMTPIISSIIGYLSIWIVLKIYDLSPEGSFTKLLDKVLGKIFGKSVSLLFIIFQIHVLAITAMDYSEFIITNFFLKTPSFIIVSSMLFLCSWVVKGGIEVLARTGQIFIPVITLCTLLICIFLIPELKATAIMPIFEKGSVPIIKGSVVVAGWYCQLTLMLYLLPMVKDVQLVRKWGYVTVAGISFFMLISNFTVFMLMGESTAFFNYPLLIAARYIAYSDFFEHVESIVMMVWVLGEFLKMSIYLFVIHKALTETFQVKNSNMLIMPLCLLSILCTYWLGRDFQTLSNFVANEGTFYILSGFVIFPVGVYCLARIRKIK